MTSFQVGKGLIWIDGRKIGPAYSGAPGAVNDESRASEKDTGPIPVGIWTIGKPVDKLTPGDELGPFCLPLTPDPGTRTFGRSGFWVHGDNASHNQSASHGCIVAARAVREQIDADPDRRIFVTD